MRVWIGRFRKVKCRATLSGTRMGKARPGPRHNGRPLGGSGRRQCNPFSPPPSRPEPGPEAAVRTRGKKEPPPAAMRTEAWGISQLNGMDSLCAQYSKDLFGSR